MPALSMSMSMSMSMQSGNFNFYRALIGGLLIADLFLALFWFPWRYFSVAARHALT